MHVSIKERRLIMQRLKPGSSKRKLNIPIYTISNKKHKSKGGFIDSNRIDTVKLAHLCHRKYYYYNLSIEEFIESEDFYNIIYNTCYNAIISDNKVVSLSDNFSHTIASYLQNFFFVNNLGIITSTDIYDQLHDLYNIQIKLNESITFEDIKSAYILELKKCHISIKNIENKYGHQLTKKMK